MPGKFRNFTKKFFFYSNILVAFFFLLACLAGHFDPTHWWFISLLGLIFPLLLLLVIFFAAGWLFLLKPRYALISGLALLLGIKSIALFFSFHTPKKFNYSKQPQTIRIATWNVAHFIELRRNNNTGSETRLKMFELIREQNADVLCMQEFFTSTDSGWYENTNYVKDSLHYPYWYFSDQYNGDGLYLGSIIFSRFPIVDSGRVKFPAPTLPEALIYADLHINTDTVRIYTTHLQSLRFFKKEYQQIEKIKKASDSLISRSRNILSKIRKATVNRSVQARLVHETIKKSPYPVVLCGDMNDVPNSYAYATVKGNMQDAFLKKGSGIGRTFSAISPTLRIDYIFADKQFKVLQFNRLVRKLSDHYMLVADVRLKTNK